MNRASLKQLAQMTIAEREVSQQLAAFVLNKLSRADLKTYLFYLKNEIAKNKVRVRLTGKPDAAFQAKLAAMFKDRTISYETVAGLGGGLQVEYGDTILDVSVRNLIERTFSRIKESI